jgi:hypothetical protein
LPPRDPSTQIDEIRSRTRELFALLRSARDLGEDPDSAVERAAAEVERRLSAGERTIALRGERNARQALLDAIVGARVFASVKREPATRLRLRAGPVIDYEAKLRGGGVERFQRSVPEREDTFAKAIARAERALAAAEEEQARAVASELEATQRHAPTLVLGTRRWWAPLLAAWVWLVSFLRGARSVTPAATLAVAAVRSDAGVNDAGVKDAAARVAAAAAHAASLRTDRDRYGLQRRESFFGSLRELSDALSRGGEVVELTIDIPTDVLPASVALLSAPEIGPEDGVDGCLLVTDLAGRSPAPFPGALGVIASRVVSPEAPAGDVRRALDEVLRAAPLVAADLAVSLARSSIGKAMEGGARVEALCLERVAALEGQRLTDPAEFRARSLGRMERAIEDGARDVLRAAIDRLPPRALALKAEWRGALLSCGDRKAVEACVRKIRDVAPARVAALGDETNDFVIGEVQRASDTMQIWLLEEIHARYHVARRASIGDGPAPVIEEAGAGELTGIDGGLLEGAMDAFEQRRVGYGLGGAAAGAVLGTLVAPVIGTAIGAFLGVLTGLLTRIDSLKQDCAARIEACVDDVAEAIRAQLESRHATLGAALRASLEEALDAAMQRFERSIARLMEVERKTLAAEHERLARLAELRASLEAHGAWFAALAEDARGADDRAT